MVSLDSARRGTLSLIITSVGSFIRRTDFVTLEGVYFIFGGNEYMHAMGTPWAYVCIFTGYPMLSFIIIITQMMHLATHLVNKALNNTSSEADAHHC